MPTTRSRTRATGDAADLAGFQEWAKAATRRRDISTEELNNKLAHTIEQDGGLEKLQQASLDGLRDWINEHPLKTKNKTKDKTPASQPTDSTAPQANAETTSATGKPGGKLRKPVVPKLEPTDEDRSTGATRGGLLKSLFASSQPAVPVAAATDKDTPTRDGSDSSDPEESDADMADRTIASQGQKQPRPLKQAPHATPADMDITQISGLLASVKTQILEADRLDLSPKEIEKLQRLRKQLEKVKASKTNKRAGGKKAPKPLLEKSSRIAPKKKPLRSRKGGPTTQDTPAWADTRGYHARSPREQLAAVRATTREIPDMDDDEMEVDTEDEEGSADARVGTARARSTANPASADATDEDEVGTGEEGEATDEEGEEEEEEEEDQEDKGGGGRRRAVEAAPKFPQKDTDIAQLLEDNPLEIPKHVIVSATPGQFKYHDHVTGTSVDATIHCVVPRGGLLISFPSRNPDYPGLRAGAVTKGSEYRQAKKDFIASQGPTSVNREASTFEGLSLDDFELFLLASAQETKSATDRYPETHILGRFRAEDYTSHFVRSTLIFVFGEDAVERLLTHHRQCVGTPHPRKAITMGWAPKTKRAKRARE